MAKKTKKQAFTIVELVIVIAVIAILAAILIPTYSNLVKKANEATALVDAKNLITEMLADILSGDKDAADLIVFSKKGDNVFLYGYDASRGMVLSYKEMPLKDFDKNITVSDGHEFYNMAASFCKKMIGTDIKEISVPENDWRDPKVLNIGTADIKCTVEELGFDKNTMAVFANYEILDGFAKKSSGGDDPVHTHDWGDPTYNWTDDYSKCTAKRVCKVASCIENETETVDSTLIISQKQSCVNDEMTKYTAVFENSAFTTQTKEIKTKDKLGHKYKYEKLNDTHHKVTCERCDYNENEAHDGATSCSKCGWAKAEVTISLNKTSLTLKFGDTETLIATVTPAGTAVTWETSNSSVATVDGNGTVKAVSNGTAIITAKAGDKAAECTVTVTDKWEIKDGLLYHNDEKYTGKNPSDVGEKGLYYVDGALASGDVDGYKFRNGMLVVEASDTLSNSGSYYRIDHKFSKTSITTNYLTDRIILTTNSYVFVNPGNQSYVRQYISIDFSGYSVANAKAYIPALKAGLDATPWTNETVNNYILEVKNTTGNDFDSDASAYPFYIQGRDYDDFKKLSIDGFTYGEYLKLKYGNNVIVTGASTANEAYFKRGETGEKMSAYAYRNDSAGMGLVIGSDGSVYGYDWSESSATYSKYTIISSNKVTNNLGNGTGYTVENSGNTYTIKYNGTVVDTLNFVLADIADYDLNAEKDKVNGMSIYSQCSDEELLAIATMYGNVTDMRIDSDPEIAELYIKAFWKQYLIRVFTSSGKQKYPLESINKDVLSGSDFYYAVYFTNGLGNAYQEFENVGPIIEFEIGIS